MDPLAEKYPSWSPYNYVMNNPLGMVDPDGKAVAEQREGGAGGSSGGCPPNCAYYEYSGGNATGKALFFTQRGGVQSFTSGNLTYKLAGDHYYRLAGTSIQKVGINGILDEFDMNSEAGLRFRTTLGETGPSREYTGGKYETNEGIAVVQLSIVNRLIRDRKPIEQILVPSQYHIVGKAKYNDPITYITQMVSGRPQGGVINFVDQVWATSRSSQNALINLLASSNLGMSSQNLVQVYGYSYSNLSTSGVDIPFNYSSTFIKHIFSGYGKR